MTVSNAAGEYEQLEREREAEEQGRGAEATTVSAGDKRPNDSAANGEDEGAARAGKKSRTDAGDAEEDEMEIEMEDDEDGQSGDLSRPGFSLTGPALPAGTTLICTNLPPECNADIMSALFSQSVLVSKGDRWVKC